MNFQEGPGVTAQETTRKRPSRARAELTAPKPGTEDGSVPEAVTEPSPDLRARDYKTVLDERYPSTTGPAYMSTLAWLSGHGPLWFTADVEAEWDAAFIAIGAQRRAFTEENRGTVDAALAEVHRRLPLTREALAWRHSLEGTRQWPWSPAETQALEPLPEPAS